jgi:hypothetical protein
LRLYPKCDGLRNGLALEKEVEAYQRLSHSVDCGSRSAAEEKKKVRMTLGNCCLKK